MRVDPAVPEEFAHQYAEALKSTPALAEDLRWCLQSIGKSSIPFLYSLYDYSELTPRLAALEAGAKLGDARAAGPLITLATKSVPALRIQAIRLLGDMPPNPSITSPCTRSSATPASKSAWPPTKPSASATTP